MTSSTSQLSEETSPSKQKFLPKFLWLVLLCLGLSTVAIYFRLSQREVNSESEVVRILPVATLRVQPVEAYQSQREYTGIVTAARTSDLSFERSGLLIEVLVKEGDSVSKGTPIAQLDNRSLQIQRQELVAQQAQQRARLEELIAGPRKEDIATAEAQVRDLVQQLELARLRQQRRQFLAQEGAISREELDQETYTVGSLLSRLEAAQSELDELLAGTRFEQIQAQKAVVEQLTAQIKQLDLEIDKTLIKAPFDGIVSITSLDEGTVVSPGQTIVRLVETGAIEARIGVPIAIGEQMSIGNEYELEIEGRKYQGRVTGILPELDPETRTVTVVLEILNSISFKTGEIARLSFFREVRTPGYWLPTSALTGGTRGLWLVYVLQETSEAEVYRVESREIEVLETQGDRVFVRGLLQPHDVVVSSGTRRVIPGQLVTLP